MQEILGFLDNFNDVHISQLYCQIFLINSIIRANQ